MTKILLENVFHTTDSYKIFHENCQVGLQKLQDSSVDCIITDPPYFIDGMGSEWNDRNLQTKAKKSGIIGGLPVGMKFDRKQGIKIDEVSKSFKRIEITIVNEKKKYQTQIFGTKQDF